MNLQIKKYEANDYDSVKSISDDYALAKFDDFYLDSKFLIQHEGELVGWYLLNLAKRKIQSTYIYLYVAKPYRRQGIATQIYNDNLKLLQQTSNSWWGDYQDSEAANAFCQKLGFDGPYSNAVLEYEGDVIDNDYKSIRVYQDEDFEIASRIWDVEYQKMHEEIGVRTNDQENDQQQKWEIYHNNKENTFVIEFDGQVVGVGQLFNNRLGIGNLAIDSKYQGRGLGKLLVSYLINECIKAGNKPIIYCEPDNKKAMHVYQSVGFKIKQIETYAVKYN